VPRAVAIYLFDEVEVLDACGPFEVFSVANRVANRVAAGDGRGAEPPFAVTCVSADGLPVRARGGLRIGADLPLAQAPVPDVCLIPGGVTDAIEDDQALLAWVQAAAGRAEVVASVCTGAFVLAAAGLLDGREATHWEDLAELRERFPAVLVRSDVRFVDLGTVATSAGVSAGIDLALHLVGRLVDLELAHATARQMDYPWQP
jgi:transcriptional regulator GlxA family with amidase domain